MTCACRGCGYAHDIVRRTFYAHDIVCRTFYTHDIVHIAGSVHDIVHSGHYTHVLSYILNLICTTIVSILGYAHDLTTMTIRTT